MAWRIRIATLRRTQRGHDGRHSRRCSSRRLSGRNGGWVSSGTRGQRIRLTQVPIGGSAIIIFPLVRSLAALHNEIQVRISAWLTAAV